MANFWKDFWYGTEEAQKRDQAKVYQQQIMSSPDFDEGQKQNLVAAFSQGDVVKAEELAKYYKQKNQERAGLSAIKNIDTQLGSAQNNQNSQQQDLSGLVNNLQSKMSDTSSSNLSQLAQSPDFKQQLDQRINSLNQPSQTQQKPDLNQIANEEVYSKGLGQDKNVQDYLQNKQKTELSTKLNKGVQQWVDAGSKPEDLLVMLSNVGMPIEELKKSVDAYVEDKNKENVANIYMGSKSKLLTPEEEAQKTRMKMAGKETVADIEAKAGARAKGSLPYQIEKSTSTKKVDLKQVNDELDRSLIPYLDLASRIPATGTIGGTVDNVKAQVKKAVGIEDPIQALNFMNDGLLSIMSRKIQAEKGTLTEGDTKRARAMLISPTDTPKIKEVKINYLKLVADKTIPTSDVIDQFNQQLNSVYGNNKPNTSSQQPNTELSATDKLIQRARANPPDKAAQSFLQKRGISY